MTNAKRKQRYNRGTDWSKITNAKLNEILAHPHTQGIDGVDYAPFREELLSEQYRRQNAQGELEIKRLLKEQAEYDKYLREQSKRSKAQKG